MGVTRSGHESLRIALVAPCWFPVPPPAYGGIELVVDLLAEGLVARGHDVTLFAAPGSTSSARVVTPLPDPPDPADLGDAWWEARHALAAFLDEAAVDVIHDHTGAIGASLAAMRSDGPPVVHTLHGPWTGASRGLYGLVHERVALVAISEAQRAANPGIRYAGVVHNGVDVSTLPFTERKDDYLVFVGRSNPEKNPAGAIEIARRAGRRLKMIVKRKEPAEQAYWRQEVQPRLGGDVEVLEDVSHATKTDVLARAAAKIFPIRWDEPFGLVMVEAMACGTPVLATPRGAATEIVHDGHTGFLRVSQRGIADAVARVGELSAKVCRDRVAERFSAEAMVERYEDLYRSVLAGRLAA